MRHATENYRWYDSAAYEQPMKALADDSALWRGEPIIDQTALSGIFEIELTYSEERRLAATLGSRATGIHPGLLEAKSGPAA